MHLGRKLPHSVSRRVANHGDGKALETEIFRDAKMDTPMHDQLLIAKAGVHI